MAHIHTFTDLGGVQRQAAYASDCDQCGTYAGARSRTVPADPGQENTMTEIITSRFESYPAAISRPPARVSGNRVLAWAELARRDGEYPGGIVLTVRGDGGEYVIWTAYTKDGGETWAACWGHYKHDHADAWADFTRRCGESRLATS